MEVERAGLYVEAGCDLLGSVVDEVRVAEGDPTR